MENGLLGDRVVGGNVGKGFREAGGELALNWGGGWCRHTLSFSKQFLFC